MRAPSRPSLDAIAARVSRSFWLSLRLLPSATRAQITTAYLLARASDTIADTDAVPVTERRALLASFITLMEEDGGAARRGDVLAKIRASIDGPLPDDAHARETALAERALLERMDEVLDAFRALRDDDRARTRAVLAVIVSGQDADLVRFPWSRDARTPAGEPPRALASRAELDDYCYRVAGVVGEFWTATQLAHGLVPARRCRGEKLRGLAVRFGKGLQMVNVLRDIPADLARGRCYLPKDALAERGLLPEDLRDPAKRAQAAPLVRELLEVGAGHVRAGIDYVEALPTSAVRPRLVCALPLAIAARTLGLVRAAKDPLDPASVRKIPRGQVYGLLAGSLARAPSLALGPWLRGELRRSGFDS